MAYNGIKHYKPLPPVKKLKTLKHIREFRRRVINHVLATELSSRSGAVISTLLTQCTKQIETEEMLERLKIVEETIAKKDRKFR